MRVCCGWLAVAVLAGAMAIASPPGAPAAEQELPLLLEENFEQGMDRWKTTDPAPARGVWQIAEAGEPGNHVLRVTGTSRYQPPHRSPHSIALLKGLPVGDFVLTARVQNTNVNAGPHRDLCFFWGYQDASHFYYVHLGAQADPHACQIFVVDDAPRIAITVDEAKGTPWHNEWHTVKIVRRVADGTMEVYFDDMTKPLMTARDARFGAGLVGIGTFDDHGNFDDIVLRGTRAAAPEGAGPSGERGGQAEPSAEREAAPAAATPNEG